MGTTYQQFMDALRYMPYERYEGRTRPVRDHLCTEICILIEKYDIPVQTSLTSTLHKLTAHIVDSAKLHGFDAHHITRDIKDRYYPD